MPTTKDTTTIQIRKITMKELKQRAIDQDMNWTEYLEEVLRKQWAIDDQKSGSVKHGISGS